MQYFEKAVTTTSHFCYWEFALARSTNGFVRKILADED